MVVNSGAWEERSCQDQCGVSQWKCFRRENERSNDAMEQRKKAIQKSCSANGSEILIVSTSFEGISAAKYAFAPKTP